MSHVCRLCLGIWLLTLYTTYGNAPHPPLVGFKDLISISPGDWKDQVFEKQVMLLWPLVLLSFLPWSWFLPWPWSWSSLWKAGHALWPLVLLSFLPWSWFLPWPWSWCGFLSSFLDTKCFGLGLFAHFYVCRGIFYLRNLCSPSTVGIHSSQRCTSAACRVPFAFRCRAYVIAENVLRRVISPSESSRR